MKKACQRLKDNKLANELVKSMNIEIAKLEPAAKKLEHIMIFRCLPNTSKAVTENELRKVACVPQPDVCNWSTIEDISIDNIKQSISSCKDFSTITFDVNF